MAEERTGHERGMGRRKRVHRPTRVQRHGEDSEPRAAPAAEEEAGGGEEGAEPETPEQPAEEGEEPEAVEEPEAMEEPAEDGAEPEAAQEPAGEEGDAAGAPAPGEEPQAGEEQQAREEQREPVAEEPAPEQEERRDDGRARRPAGVAQIARTARAQLQELIGRPVTAVLGVERRDGNWEVDVETVELQRVPETTSIMGLYRVTLDEDGEIMEFRRVRRYNRAQAGEDGGA